MLHNKEQFALQSTEQFTVQPSVHPTVHSNCVYGVTVLAIVAIRVYVSFSYNAFQPKNKKLINEKQDQPPKRRHTL